VTTVAIVGGGVVGTMHAWMARRRGLDVVHLDRDAEPRRASVRNFGLVWVSGRARGAELTLALRSRELWEAIGAEVPGVGFRPNGSLTVALHRAELAVMEEMMAQADAAARRMKLLQPVEVSAVNPAVRGEIEGALFCERDAVVEPRLALPAIRAHLEARGGYRFLPSRDVVGIDGGDVVDHTGEHHRADLVVLATGDAYSGVAAPQLTGAPLRRCRLQMCQTAPLRTALTTSIADGDSLRYYPAFQLPSRAGLDPPAAIVARHHMQLLLVQRANGELTIGDTHAYDEPFDFAVEEEAYAYLLARAERILGTALPPVRRRWAGVYSQSTDDRVVHRAGRLDGVADGVIVVTGLGGRGMTLAPAVAEETFAELGA
jgi:FAD dependent oxidoreductase TIGR03364